ncbi:exlusion protein FxsA [Methylovorus sp. MM2]|uniref:FxsA family protein n=1 Tax=Methylovorus sp. MM2 TaxID=1848038 RepID=UPI0007E1EF69|nr:FxsA family protein [Methylovorus sp. MM2]OAM51953.1 exlusion protein FxsA [Methylovorus sp. MM2]
MPLFFLLVILLVFPVLEIWLLVELGHRYGAGLLVYLVLIAILGWRLIQDEKSLIIGRLAQTVMQGGTPVKAIFGSAKNLIAGILLIIPGVLSDILAAILLLIPSPKPISGNPKATSRKAANDDVIEGEYRRED